MIRVFMLKKLVFSNHLNSLSCLIFNFIFSVGSKSMQIYVDICLIYVGSTLALR